MIEIIFKKGGRIKKIKKKQAALIVTRKLHHVMYFNRRVAQKTKRRYEMLPKILATKKKNILVILHMATNLKLRRIMLSQISLMSVNPRKVRKQICPLYVIMIVQIILKYRAEVCNKYEHFYLFRVGY